MKNIKKFEDFVGSSHKTNEEAEGKGYKVKLTNIVNLAKQIMEFISDEEDLEAWVQDKITIAEHNMDAILGYMQSEKDDQKIPIQGDMATGKMLKSSK